MSDDSDDEEELFSFAEANLLGLNKAEDKKAADKAAADKKAKDAEATA